MTKRDIEAMAAAMAWCQTEIMRSDIQCQQFNNRMERYGEPPLVHQETEHLRALLAAAERVKVLEEENDALRRTIAQTNAGLLP